MKIESGGGSTAESGVTRKLARLYDEELDRAERDFPTIRTPLWDADERHQPRRRMKLRLAAEAIGIVAVVAILVGGGWLALGPSTTPAGPAPGPAASGGVPVQIDGQRVYRIVDVSEWQNLGGSFLLAATPSLNVMSCFAVVPAPSGSAERSLIQATCGKLPVGTILGGGVMLAPKSEDLILPWIGSAIVTRVHTHDSEAASCADANRAQCDAAVVVEAVVWPTVPTEIAGEPVYRASDKATFPTSGGFLLGGRFSKPDFVPPCPMPPDKTAAEQQLLPYCYLESIDGLDISPMSNIDEPKNEIVVARVHVNDPLAAQCPAATQADCRAAIVVESVVWRSDELINSMPSSGTAGPTPTSSAGASANPSGPSTGTGEGTAPPPPGASASVLMPPPPPSPLLPNAS